jgi:hypothetical protein
VNAQWKSGWWSGEAETVFYAWRDPSQLVEELKITVKERGRTGREEEQDKKSGGLWEGAVHSLSQKGQLGEGRVSTVEDGVDASSSIPHDLTIAALDVQDAMLRNELFVRQVLLPRPKTGLEASLKSILIANNKVTVIETRIQ